MMDVTVKTLDGQNRNFSVPEDITVRAFKEKIANSITITADTQRLIFQGRVLQDEKLLKEYDVHGKVIHVVLRPPPSGGRPPGGPDNPQTNTLPHGARDPNSVVVGSFTLPSDVIDANMVQNIAQDAIRSMGDMGRNARVSTRSSTDGSAVDVHIHLGPVQGGGTTSEAQMRLNTARQMMRLATEALNQLENSNSPSGATSEPGQATTSSTGESREPESTQSTKSGSSQEPESSQPGSDAARGETVTVTSSADSRTSPTPMETEEQEGSTAPAQAANENAASGSPDQSNQATPNGSQPPTGPVRPNISALGEVLVEVADINERLRPHIEHFTRIVRADAEMDENEQRENGRVCNLVAEAMHAMSHSYHAVSDLMVDLSQQRPRNLYVTLAIAQPHTAVIQHSIPVQAQIQIGGSPRSIRRQFGPPRPPSTTAPVSVPSTIVTGTQTSTTTTSTGTSTGSQPNTAETGTQSGGVGVQQTTGTQSENAANQSAGVQGGAGLNNEQMQRIQQQMSAGLQSVLGQGNGTPENPFVFVEMGPNSMTVNSISAEVVTSDDAGNQQHVNVPPADTTAPTSQPAAQNPGSAQNQGSAQGQATFQGQATPQGQGPAQGGQAGLPPNFLQNIMQQISQQAGMMGAQGTPQRMQINIGQGLPGGMPPGISMGMPGMPAGMPGMMGIRLGPRIVRPGAPNSETATQTAGPNGVPANSGTQTSTTPTNVSGTQTSGAGSTPNSTSGTQTAGAPRAQAFVVPGMPGLAQNVSPVDGYLPCSSRHFLTPHARSIINNNGNRQNNDTALADMVTNLMSGLLGGRSAPGGTGTTNTSSPAGAGSQAGGGAQPRPSGARLAMPPGASIQIGGLPPGLAGMFPGGLQQGAMRFRMPGRVPTAPPSRPGVPPMRPQQTGSAQGPPMGTSPTGGPATGATGGEPQFVNMLRQFLSSANQEQAGSQSTGTQSTQASTQSTQANNQSSSSGAGTGQAGQQPISDEAFTQLVSGITGYMSQAAVGQAPRQTIADFLSGLGESYNVPQGEGFINECLSCVLASLQITDLIQVFYGQPTPLNQVQRPLREFISTRVLDGLPPLQGTIRDAVETLVDSMQPEIAEAVAVSQPRPHIDFQATLMGFFSQNLFNIITLAMNARENDPNFGADLYACVRRTLSELYILCGRCLGGREAVENLLANRLQRFTSGVNPFIQEWMSSMTLRQLSGFYPSITVTEGEISHFIVYKSVGQPSGATQSRTQTKSSAKPVSKSSAASNATPTSSSATESERSTVGTSTSTKPESSPLQAPVLKQAIKQKEESQPMETSPPVSSTSPGASEVEMDTVTRETPTREVKGAASADSSSSGISPITNGNQPSPVGAQAGSDNWESVVPAEWVPVISRDIEAQRQSAQQRPFSDVYMQGMPPKRRKMMADQKATDLSNSARALPHSIQRAVAAAAVEPISSMENLQTELAADTSLQEAFQSEVSSSLAERLESDSDFRAERFPNSNEYYHKSAGKK